MTKNQVEKKDPNKGATRIVATAVKVPKKSPSKLKELLDQIAAHKPVTGILNDVDRICKAKGLDQIMLRVKIDKPRAMELFSRNILNNRDLKWRDIEHYALLMKKGKWDYNGDVIRFTRDGKLMDTQHRLLAIILSDTTQIFHMEGGFPPENIKTIDVGHARSAKDLLKMKGITTHPNTMAAAIKNIITFRQSARIHGNVHGDKVDNIAIDEFIQSNKENVNQLASYCELGLKVYHHENPYFTASQWGFLYYILARTKDRRDTADMFITALTTGKQLNDRGPSSPIYHLRRLLNGWKNTRFVTLRPGLQLTLKVKYTIEYWNCYVTADRGRIDQKKGLILTKDEIESPFINSPL